MAVVPFQPGQGPPVPGRSRRSTLTGAVVAPTDTSLLAQALDAAEQTPVVALRADWSRDGYLHSLADVSTVVDEVSVERSATGDLPDGIGLVEASRGRVTATLSGISPTHQHLRGPGPLPVRLGPYLTPTLGVPMTCVYRVATDAGPELVRQSPASCAVSGWTPGAGGVTGRFGSGGFFAEPLRCPPTGRTSARCWPVTTSLMPTPMLFSIRVTE